MNVKKLCQEQEPYIIEMRRWFHRHPEVSFQEEKTSAKIQEELKNMGISYELLPPNHGVIATIKGELGEGKTLVLRADMDALPVCEDTGLEFASENEGVMHACGHDAHVAMLLGAAKVLNEQKGNFYGTVKLLFQVAEEIGGGYEEVMDYLDANGGADGFAGLHIWSAIPEGEILLLPQAIFAGGGGFTVTIHGQGGHGARPDLVKDPIKAACDLVLKLASIPSNFYDVLDHSVVTTCMVEAGTLGNIFPSEARITGTMRWFKMGGSKYIIEKIEQIAAGVGQIYGVDCEVSCKRGIEPIINNPEMIETAKKLVEYVDGLAVSEQTDPISASDNYGHFLAKYSGFYGVLGGGKRGEEIYPQHHRKFDIDEKSLRKGAEFMTRYALEFLGGK